MLYSAESGVGVLDCGADVGEPGWYSALCDWAVDDCETEGADDVGGV